MPQLEPQLWACTGLTAWSVLLGYIPGKITSHYYSYQASVRPSDSLPSARPKTNKTMKW